jgi:hypothetical protein
MQQQIYCDKTRAVPLLANFFWVPESVVILGESTWPGFPRQPRPGHLRRRRGGVGVVLGRLRVFRVIELGE